MDATNRLYDVIAMGRSSIDLYSNDIGAPFVEITSFAAYVGGCPTNISVGTRRLGLRPALLTAVGEDVVGDFILHFLQQEGVETAFIPRKPGRRTSAVVLGIEPPDKFPLVYYRDNCADIALNGGDVQSAIRGLLALGPRALVEKRGAQGARVHLSGAAEAPTPIEVPGFPVEVANILGAGDAFASGFLFGHLSGWDWYKAARLGNACGAIVVTRHGCANFMPTYEEVMAFVEQHGGF